MPDTTWKAFARRLAQALGTGRVTGRVPVTGERAGADFGDGMFGYQAKLGRRCSAYLRDWLAGIVAAAERPLGGRGGLEAQRCLGRRRCRPGALVGRKSAGRRSWPTVSGNALTVTAGPRKRA